MNEVFVGEIKDRKIMWRKTPKYEDGTLVACLRMEDLRNILKNGVELAPFGTTFDLGDARRGFPEYVELTLMGIGKIKYYLQNGILHPDTQRVYIEYMSSKTITGRLLEEFENRNI